MVRAVPPAATVTFPRIAYAIRCLVSTESEGIGRVSYNQSPELMGYRLFRRYLLRRCQRQVGRCMDSAHRWLSESRPKSSVTAWARSPLKWGRHELPRREGCSQ